MMRFIWAICCTGLFVAALAQQPQQTEEPPATEESSQPPDQAAESGSNQQPAESQSQAPATDETPVQATQPTDPVDQALAALPPIVDYRINARLYPEEKRIAGDMELRYTNHSPDVIPDLWFHLYLNAFKNELSTYYRESGGHGGDPAAWGYVDINNVKIGDQPITWAYIQPDGTDPGDQTVARLPLPTPLLPGETVTVSIDFTSLLPQVFERTGYYRDFFLVAQWFPKVGVWETAGHRQREEAGWNCHPFHAFTEFYANFGVFDVNITLPKEYEIGATGVMIGKKEDSELTTYRFKQDRVHDFCFTASPRFIRVERIFRPEEHINSVERYEAMERYGITKEDVALNDVNMILLIQPEHEHQIERHFHALTASLKYCGLNYGAYPYETITMVDPAWMADGAAGMEYPNLITLGTTWFKDEDDYRVEGVTVHEFIHQYWYGMVATNEFEESWMDEGFTSYTEGEIMDQVYGTQGVFGTPRFVPLEFPGGLASMTLPFGYLSIKLNKVLGFDDLKSVEMARAYRLARPTQDPIAMDSWSYRNSRSYGMNSYTKPELMLQQLKRELGDETLAKVMRAYFQQWSFKHPGEKEFIRVVEEVSGREMDWFFDALLHHPDPVDFKVAGVSNVWWGDAFGYFDTPSGRVRNTNPAEPITLEPEVFTPHFRCQVELENNGRMPYPVEVLVVFEDGSEKRERWDGKGLWTRFSYESPVPVAKVVIDPDNKMLYDENRANNSYVATPQSKAADKWSVRLLRNVQHMLQNMAGGF